MGTLHKLHESYIYRCSMPHHFGPSSMTTIIVERFWCAILMCFSHTYFIIRPARHSTELPQETDKVVKSCCWALEREVSGGRGELWDSSDRFCTDWESKALLHSPSMPGWERKKREVESGWDPVGPDREVRSRREDRSS